MKATLLLVTCLVVLLTVAKCDTNCEEKEKSLISLDVAEDLISKAKELFPNCTDVVTTNTSECSEKEKASAYLDLAKKLIIEAKENYPTCIGDISKDLVTEEPTTKYPITTEHVTGGPTTKYPIPTEPVTENPVTKDPIEYPKSRDCYELLQNGQNKTGIYTIWPNSSSFPNRSLDVRCDMDTDKGGWTVIQRRGDFTPQEDFYRNWNDYKHGFGSLTKDFWLGNDNIFILTNQRKYKVRFDLESANGEKAYAVYELFRIENEDSRYKLQIDSYKGNAGDSMSNPNGQYFSTKDSGNIGCATGEKAGWWYRSCGYANLNGKYIPGRNDRTYEYFYWYDWKKEGLAAAEIKIKPSVS